MPAHLMFEALLAVGTSTGVRDRGDGGWIVWGIGVLIFLIAAGGEGVKKLNNTQSASDRRRSAAIGGVRGFTARELADAQKKQRDARNARASSLFPVFFWGIIAASVAWGVFHK